MKYLSVVFMLVLFSCKDNNPHKIEKIQFVTGMCFGSCPIFEIDIKANREAEFYAQGFNYADDDETKEIKGVFISEIDEVQYDKVIKSLNDVDFIKLPDHYGPDDTDVQDARLIVTYDGGKVKDITINHISEVTKFDIFRSVMFDLRFNQKWRRVKMSAGFNISTPISAGEMLPFIQDSIQ